MSTPQITIGCASNVYIRVMEFASIGDCEDGHQHEFDHFTLLAAGALLLEIEEDDIAVTYEAPCLIFIDKNKRHKLTAKAEGTVAACIHALRIGERVEDILPFESLPINLKPLVRSLVKVP